jgi:hypothetical protein
MLGADFTVLSFFLGCHDLNHQNSYLFGQAWAAAAGHLDLAKRLSEGQKAATNWSGIDWDCQS